MKNYWQFIPSGLGKHDSEELLKLSDKDFIELWDRAAESRFNQAEMDAIRTVSALTPTVLTTRHHRLMISIGSGMGFHEMTFARLQWDVQYYDIVESNLKVIRRIAELKNQPNIYHVRWAWIVERPLKYDLIWLWGSLHHMTKIDQVYTLGTMQRELRSGGHMVIMSYTWDYARRILNIERKEQFDPVAFGRLSDPVVGDEVCPYADWHDAASLHAMLPGMTLKHTEIFNNGDFAWYLFQS